MSSTRVIRPNSFRIETRIKADRPTQLPTPAKLLQDTGPFQDIGSKLVRPSSRKEKSWLARSKGLRTSAGLEQQLLKEEGIKISIGDKTLKQLLEIEVPETRKQEYIKADGSIGVRQVPVLDAMGNPVLVKKKLSIPGSIEHFQKPMKEKLAEMSEVLKDQTKTLSEKSDLLAVLLSPLLKSIPLEELLTDKDEKTIVELVKLIAISEDPTTAGMPVDGLELGRFVKPAYLGNNTAMVTLYLLKYAQKRGLPEGAVLYDVNGNPIKLKDLSLDNVVDDDGNERTIDLKSSKILPTIAESREVKEEKELKEVPDIPPFVPIVPKSEKARELFDILTDEEIGALPANFEELSGRAQEVALSRLIGLPIERPPPPPREKGLQGKSERVRNYLFANFTLEEQKEVNKTDFEALSSREQFTMLQTIVESREEVKEEFVKLKIHPETLPFLEGLTDDDIHKGLKDLGMTDTEFNEAGIVGQQVAAENVQMFIAAEGKEEEFIFKSEAVERVFNMLSEDQKDAITKTEFNTMGDTEQEGFLNNIIDTEIQALIGEESPPIVQQFINSLDEEEKQNYQEMLGMELKEGVILVPSRSMGTLSDIIDGRRKKERTTAAINKALGLDIAKLSDRKIGILKKMRDNFPSMIRSSSGIIGSGMEGSGHKMSMYGIAYHGPKYGYTRPHYPLQQQMRV